MMSLLIAGLTIMASSEDLDSLLVYKIRLRIDFSGQRYLHQLIFWTRVQFFHMVEKLIKYM